MKKGKKSIALFLAFSLMMLSANLYAKERRGAKLIVTKKDGQLIEGELITVKPNSLLLLDTEGKDVSIDIEDIKVIRVVKKSKALLGAGLGFLIGAAVGAAVGGSLEAGWLHGGIEMSALIGGLAFGALGGFIVSSEGKDKTIQIEGMSDFHEFREALEYLRKKARIRDYK